MAWPTRRALWGEAFSAAKDDYARLAQAVSRYEPVFMVACEEDRAEAARCCGPGITIVTAPIDDSWSRDSGPIFLAGRSLVATSWNFNAWGDKFRPFDRDARLPRRIAEHLGIDCIEAGITLEGGGILSDGEGTLYATETCILNDNRNRGVSKSQVEREMKRMLGAAKILWLPGDQLETGTDGHIDGIFALCAPAKGLLEVTPDPADARFQILEENRRALELATDARGRSIEFTTIAELPRAVSPCEGFCRSYVNFYIGNGAVFAPCYGHALDHEVADVLRKAFPDRELVSVPIGRIPVGGGGFHCITQQQPKL